MNMTSSPKRTLKVLEDPLEGETIAKATCKIMENQEVLENARLDVAVTGESGSGKSSFVNAIRGLGDEDGAAPTGVVGTTLVPIPCSHPKHPNLPGTGTLNFQSSIYREQDKFFSYDFLILVASERFKPNHAHLQTGKIQEVGNRFYFVRSKVDADLEVAPKRPQVCKGNTILGEIRGNCQQCLQNEGLDSPQVFLLFSWELSTYDFMALEETLEKELPRCKRHTFLLALPNISFEILDKNQEALKEQIWKWATVLCGVAAMPIPGLAVACDVTILMKSLSKGRQSFGLEDESQQKLAENIAKPGEEIKGMMESPLAKEISRDLVLKLLSDVVGRALMAAKYFISTVLVFGPLVASGISFAKTSYMLWSCLDEAAEEAHCVLIQAFGSDV